MGTSWVLSQAEGKVSATPWAHRRLGGCWWPLVFCAYRAEVSSLKAKHFYNQECLYHMDLCFFKGLVSAVSGVLVRSPFHCESILFPVNESADQGLKGIGKIPSSPLPLVMARSETQVPSQFRMGTV